MPCKNTLYSLSIITIPNNSLLQILQFSSSGVIFQLQYTTRCHPSKRFCSRYAPNIKSNTSISTTMSNFSQQILRISSQVNNSLNSLNNFFYSIPYTYGFSFFISLINGLIIFNHYAINLLQQLQNPRNNLNCIMFSSSCQLTIASTFFRSILILPSLIINSIKLVFLIKNSHFLIATSIYSSCSLFKNYLMYSSLLSKQIIMLLRYTIINLLRCSPNILLIRFWNITSIFISLNYITNSLYSPSFNLKAAFYLLPSVTERVQATIIYSKVDIIKLRT